MRSDPLFILSKSNTLEQYKKASDLGTVSYSFKTNKDVGYILRDNTDSFFSVHADESIDLLDCPDRIWFFAQGWDDDEITNIIKKGVSRFVVDNENDLDILLKHIKKNNNTIQLLLRMRLKEHTIHTGKHFVFGMYSKDIIRLIPKLKSNPLISKLGIHFHRKTQNISEWSLKYELEGTLPKDILTQLDIVNIGGGMPSRYKNFRKEVQDRIFRKINEIKDWLKTLKIKMIIEPGRFISAPAMDLETEIVNIYDRNIIVNCSVYSGVMDTFVSHIRLLVKGEKEKGGSFTIKGKTPDSVDILRYDVRLDSPKVGDTIVFLNAGAYTFSTDFCGLKPVKVKIID